MGTMIFEFDEAKAQKIEQELKTGFPQNEWGEGYIVRIIKMSCHNVDGDYFHGHHGAFDAYLKRFGKFRVWCEQCEELFFADDPNAEFCSNSCEREWMDWH